MAHLRLLYRQILLLCVLQGSFASGSKVLVTGGASFIGFHASLRLSEKGHEVVLLDNFNNDDAILRKKASILSEKGVQLLRGSCSDIHDVQYVFNHHPEITGIVHAVSSNEADPLKAVSDNIEPLVNLLDVIRKREDNASLVRLVYLSSFDVYSSANPLPFSTSSELSPPKYMLAAMKMSGESLINGYTCTYPKSFSSVILRLFSVYGPWSSPGNAVYDIAKTINDDKPIEIPHRNGSSVQYDFVYIDDVLDFVEQGLQHTIGSGTSCVSAIFNVGNGVGVALKEVAKMLMQELEKEVKIGSTTLADAFIHTSYADMSDRLKSTSQTSLKEGISKFVKWFKSRENDASSKPATYDSIHSKAFDEFIDHKNKAFIKRIGDLREKYTTYAEAHNIPVAKFYRHKTYKYFPGVDSGNNRRKVDGPIENAKEICNIVDECVAFNAHGQLKGIIDHQSKWGKGPGLYVAEIDVCEAGLHNCFGNSTCTYKGPAQFECSCHEGYGWIHGRCVELYVEGRVSQVEADEKLADYIDGRNWKDYVGRKTEFYIFTNKDDFSADGELVYYPQASGNVEKLKEACLKTYHCIGFSSDGLLRRGIGQPRHWKSSENVLYILDVDYCSLDPFRCTASSHCRRERPGMYSC